MVRARRVTPQESEGRGRTMLTQVVATGSDRPVSLSIGI